MNEKNIETFYISQYRLLKNELLFRDFSYFNQLSHFNIQQYTYGGTLLHDASFCKFENYVSILLHDGMNIMAKNKSGYTSYQTAES